MTILAVDDRQENLSVLVNLLEPIGFKVLEASNGQEGLDKIVEHRPNLVISDIAMPIKDGYEMMTELRQMKDSTIRSIPLIVSSASVFESDRYESFEAGANEFLPKPIQASSLLAALQKLLNLKWNYEEVEVPSRLKTEEVSDMRLVMPPVAEVEKLYDLARRGFINDLVTSLEQLQAEQSQYGVFVQTLLTMAKGFKVKDIREFLKGCLGGEPENI